MHKFITALLLLFFNVYMHAQKSEIGNVDGEYIINPSFEMRDGCPIAAGEFYLCQSWYCPWARESPDYFCVDCDSLANNIVLDSLDSKDGNCFVRLIIRYWKYFSAQEHIQTRLTNSLEKGTKYKLTFYVRTGEGSNYFTDRIAVALTRDSVESFNIVKKKRYYMIQCKNAILIRDKHFFSKDFQWQKIELEFIAKGSENFITIGIFANNLVGYKRENLFRTGKGDASKVGYYDFDMFDIKVVR